jgi:hypothetical protein
MNSIAERLSAAFAHLESARIAPQASELIEAAKEAAKEIEILQRKVNFYAEQIWP